MSSAFGRKAEGVSMRAPHTRVGGGMGDGWIEGRGLRTSQP